MITPQSPYIHTSNYMLEGLFFSLTNLTNLAPEPVIIGSKDGMKPAIRSGYAICDKKNPERLQVTVHLKEDGFTQVKAGKEIGRCVYLAGDGEIAACGEEFEYLVEAYNKVKNFLSGNFPEFMNYGLSHDPMTVHFGCRCKPSPEEKVQSMKNYPLADKTIVEALGPPANVLYHESWFDLTGKFKAGEMISPADSVKL